MKNQKLPVKTVSLILSVAPITISRLAKSDDDFPNTTKIGRSLFIDSEGLYRWLSKKSGCNVAEGDQVLKTKDLQRIFNKSSTWIWQNVKSKTLPEPFYVGRNKFWMNSQIQALLQSEAV